MGSSGTRAKENLTYATVSAVEQLQVMTSKRQYKEAATQLETVVTVLQVMVARSGQLVYVQISFSGMNSLSLYSLYMYKSDLTVLSQYMFYSFHVFAVSNPGNKE
ncbi:unnamed protein product [Arabidopsis halleri]